ncbi:MAG: M10 family metallopeptidase C-terminal domain-containing protein [Caulobacter sp.]|nr:M10 family metallopeptidase C-terminal domain-containing protein [Caulobacter sp.]
MAYRFGLASLRDVAATGPLAEVSGLSSFRAQAAYRPDSGAGPTVPTSKSATGFIPDGVGVLKPTPPVTPAVLLTLDAQSGDTSTTAAITVGGAHIVSTINSIGDQDFFRIDLLAGQTYEIGMYMKVGGPNLVPLADSYIELYDAAGNLLVGADGGGPNSPSGLDALLTYTAEHSGTYYINARAFDNLAQDGANGDLVGDYELFAQIAPAGGYRPYYTADSPLYAIDWGSQVDGSSRNPDGQEGPRQTENAFTGTASNNYGIVGKNVITYYLAQAGDIFIDEDPTTPGTTDTMVAKGWSDWEIDALNLAFDAYEAVADIVYVRVDTRTEADFVFVTYLGTPGPGVSLLGRMSPPDEENEGRGEFNAFDERWTAEGLAPGGFTFTTLIHEMGHGHGLAHPHDNGGRSGVMNGVESEGAVADYTNGDFDLNQSIYTMMSYEDGWELSPYGQAETTDPFGWLGSLMAFDVAAIQDKYGVNETSATGDDVYLLDDENVAGTYYSCIWDAGGQDEIRYTGSRDATIDLRAATLQYEYGGGGWLSYAYGVFGGFTIANGVTIENASGGDGDDTLTGNDAANTLNGGLGDDLIRGGAGDDLLIDADGGADTLYGEAGNDTLRVVRAAGATGTVTLDGGVGDDRFIILAGSGLVSAIGGDGDDRFEALGAASITTGAGVDRVVLEAAFAGVVTITDFRAGAAGDQLDLGAWFAAHLTSWTGGSNPFADGHARLLGSGGDTLIQVDADGGGDTWTTIITLKNVNPAALTGENLGYAPGGALVEINGTSGADILTGSAAADLIRGLDGNDMVKGLGGADQLNGDAGDDGLYGGEGHDQLFGGEGSDSIYGEKGNDLLDGGTGRDWMVGGAGADVLTGGQGGDAFIFQQLGDSTVLAPDQITDFNPLEDRIDLRGIDANAGLIGNQDFHFVSAFTHAAGEALLTYDEDEDLTTLALDVNGDGVADFALQVDGQVEAGAGWYI